MSILPTDEDESVVAEEQVTLVELEVSLHAPAVAHAGEHLGDVRHRGLLDTLRCSVKNLDKTFSGTIIASNSMEKNKNKTKNTMYVSTKKSQRRVTS